MASQKQNQLSLFSMLEQTKEGQSNRVCVYFVPLKTDLYFDIPRNNWYSITVKEFEETVSQRLPDNSPPCALFISIRGREQILPENALLSSYDITNPDCVLLLKQKPKIIHLLFHKQFYVDSDVSVQDAIPLIHYALSRHEWVDEENEIYLASPDTSEIPLERTSRKLITDTSNLTKLNESDRLYDKTSESESSPPLYFLCDDARPLLACSPTSMVEVASKGPKKKILSYTNRNSDDETLTKQNTSATTEDTPARVSLPEITTGGVINTDLTQSAETVLKLEPVDKPQERRRARSFLTFRTESFLRRGKDTMKADEEVFTPDSLNIPIHLQSLTALEDNGKRFYGLPLETVMQRTNEPGPVPRFIMQLAEHLEKSDAFLQEGIFRLCGNNDRIHNLISEIDSGEPLDLEKYDIHEVANALKLYFQLLPQPVLTFKLYPRFMAAVCLEDTELRNTYYNALLASVPEIRRKVSRFVIDLLRKVASFKSSNKMGPKNLGIVFGPLLLRCQKQENDVYKSFLHYSKYIIKCIKHFIKSYDDLYRDVPGLEVVRSLSNYTAKKPGELDLAEGSIIYIFSKGEEECFSESNGRFGTLPTRFLFDSQGKLKCLEPISSPKSPQIRAVKSKAARNLRKSGTKSITRKKKKTRSGTLNDSDFVELFGVPRDIFLLLPKWKQDEMLIEAGLLDAQEIPTPPPVSKVTRTTIPVRAIAQRTNS